MAATVDDVRVRCAVRKLLRDRCCAGEEGITAADGRTFRVTDLSTGKGIGTVPSLRLAATRGAIASAERASPMRRAKTAGMRAPVLCRGSELVTAHAYGIAFVMARAEEAARGSRERDCVRPFVHRLIHRGGLACPQRCDPANSGLAEDLRGEAAGRRPLRRFPHSHWPTSPRGRRNAGCVQRRHGRLKRGRDPARDEDDHTEHPSPGRSE